jgi:hypothetical protein
MMTQNTVKYWKREKGVSITTAERSPRENILPEFPNIG